MLQKGHIISHEVRDRHIRMRKERRMPGKAKNYFNFFNGDVLETGNAGLRLLQVERRCMLVFKGDGTESYFHLNS